MGTQHLTSDTGLLSQPRCLEAESVSLQLPCGHMAQEGDSLTPALSSL